MFWCLFCHRLWTGFFFALVFSKATTQKKKANSDRVPYLQPATLLKKRSWHRYFSVNFTILLETAFYGIPTSDCFLLFRSCTLSKCYNQDIKMTTTEAILLALLLTLKMFFSAVIWKPLFRTTSQIFFREMSMLEFRYG